MNDLYPGCLVGEYILEARIGAGGGGEVWSARAITTQGHEPLALKFLLADVESNSKERVAFLDEVRIASKLIHDNVVRVYGLHQFEFHMAISMELVDGSSLHGLAANARKERIPIPAHFVTLIALDCVRGLRYAHEASRVSGKHLDVVHRDVSPRNILVGRNGVSKIADFGIAVFEGRLTHTQSGSVKGKLGYMAPEQLMFGEADIKTDVFCAGIVFWELLCNRRLFDRPTRENLTYMFTNGIPSVQSLNPDVPDKVNSLVSKMLAIQPEDRPAGMEPVEDALKSLVHNEVELRRGFASWLAVSLSSRRLHGSVGVKKTARLVLNPSAAPSSTASTDEMTADEATVTQPVTNTIPDWPGDEPGTKSKT